MSSQNPFAENPNPYAAPSVEAQKASIGGANSLALSKTIKDFRSQSLALGVAWIIFGLLAGGLGVFLVVARDPSMEAAAILIPLFLVIAACWMVSGIATLAKQIWGVYFGLVISCISAVGNVINLNICGLVIIVAIIIQAVRVIGFANTIRKAGLPLTAPP